MEQRDPPSYRSGVNPRYSVLSPACSTAGPHRCSRAQLWEGKNGAGGAGKELRRAEPNTLAPDVTGIRELFRDFQDPVSGDLTG